MDRLTWMQSFVRAAETSSFSAVARELDTTQPTVSKHIAALEQHLGARLFNRSTRSLTLTDEGGRYYEHAQRILEHVDSAEAELRGGGAEPVGTLRINAPVTFGRMHIVPYISEFLALYPKVSVEVDLADRFVDIIEEGVDVAVRIGTLDDSALVARRIGMTQRELVATPQYLDANGAPDQPAALKDHNCVIYTALRTARTWSFTGPDGDVSVDVDGNFRTSSSEGALAGVRAGAGIGLMPCWMIGDLLDSGELVPVLPGYAAKAMPIQAVFPSSRHMSAKVRKFVDFLGELFGRDDVHVHGV